MNKKLMKNLLAIGGMIVLSLGIIVGIKYTNGDFSAKDNGVPLSVEGYANDNVTVNEAYRLEDGEVTSGYTVTVTTVGFNPGMPIVTKISFASDKQTITNIEVLEQMETPGLGGKIAEEGFSSMFENVTAPVYTADMEQNGTSFDQITGATITSKAMATAINAACEFLTTVE